MKSKKIEVIFDDINVNSISKEVTKNVVVSTPASGGGGGGNGGGTVNECKK